MTVDAGSGNVTWVPKSTGNHTCVLKATDGRGGMARQGFTISVLDALKPSIRPIRPSLGETLKGKVLFSGSVIKGTREVLSVQLRIDGLDWRNATGTGNWSIRVETANLKNGVHTFELRAFDGVEFSDTVTMRFKVENPPGNKGFIPMLDAPAYLVMALILLFVGIWKRDR